MEDLVRVVVFWPVQFPSEMYEWVQTGAIEKLKSLSPAIEAMGSFFPF